MTTDDLLSVGLMMIWLLAYSSLIAKRSAGVMFERCEVLKMGQCDKCCLLSRTMDSRLGGPAGPLPAVRSLNFLCLKRFKLSKLSPGSVGMGVPKEVSKRRIAFSRLL